MNADLATAVADFMTDHDPDVRETLYRRMVEEDPVLWCPIDGGVWIVSSFEHASAVLADNTHFARRGTQAVDRIAVDGTALEALKVRMVLQDEPDHGRLRSLVNRAFTPRAVSRLRLLAVEISERLIAGVYERGEMEVTKEFSYPFTVEMIATMMGLPVADGPKLIDWTYATISAQDDESVRRAEQAATEMAEYFVSHAEGRAPVTSEGILTALAQAEVDGDRLSRAELTAVCWELVAAGHETTANMIPNALVTLLRNPEQLALVRGDRSLLPAAVEESLRYEPPLPSPSQFFVVSDVTVGGKQMAPGDRVRVWIAAANRDPARFPDPDAFDVTRPDNRHLAFSHGSHFCLGAALARMETEVALASLVELPDLELGDPAPEWRSSHLRALRSLTVRWNPTP
ncbi:MAG: cytochrome P450 [Microbacterium sp.]